MGDAQNCAERAQDLCGDQDPWRARGPDPGPRIGPGAQNLFAGNLLIVRSDSGDDLDPSLVHLL
jgi:hypothetical protein